ncbi:c-type cytochrome [Mucilaginibacter sp. AW1-3]
MKLKLIIITTSLIGLMAFTNGTVSQPQLPVADTTHVPSKFGFGQAATPQDIAKIDIAIRPDGKGLPAGQGDVAKGKALYILKCSSCHGQNGTETPGVKLAGPALVGDTSAKSKPKTIGNYWPYATTLFDYMRRTMPYDHPGSLTDNEIYSLTAYLLNANKIITADVVLDAKTLPKITMPAKKLFITDDRKGGPEVK